MRDAKFSLIDLVGLLGALASIFAVWIWMNESDERAESSKLREASLIAEAREILEAESADEIFQYSQEVNWALRVYAHFGHTAKIAAEKVDLMFADLRCVMLEIESSEISVANSVLLETQIDVGNTQFEIDRSIIEGLYITDIVDDGDKPRSVYRVSNSIVDDISVFTMHLDWPEVILDEVFINEISVTSAPRSLIASGPAHLINFDVDESSCSILASNEKKGISYLECELKKASEEVRIALKAKLFSESPGLQLFGEMERSLCKTREKIEFTRSPFWHLENLD